MPRLEIEYDPTNDPEIPIRWMPLTEPDEQEWERPEEVPLSPFVPFTYPVPGRIIENPSTPLPFPV